MRLAFDVVWLSLINYLIVAADSCSGCCADLCDMVCHRGVVKVGVWPVVLTSVTWIVCFVSQGGWCGWEFGQLC